MHERVRLGGTAGAPRGIITPRQSAYYRIQDQNGTVFASFHTGSMRGMLETMQDEPLLRLAPLLVIRVGLGAVVR